MSLTHADKTTNQPIVLKHGSSCQKPYYKEGQYFTEIDYLSKSSVINIDVVIILLTFVMYVYMCYVYTSILRVRVLVRQFFSDKSNKDRDPN